MPRFTMTWGRTGPKPSGKHNTRRPGATPPRWEFYWADRVGVGSTSITLGADLSDGGSNALNSGDRFDGWAPVDWCDLCGAGRSEAGAPPTIWLLLRISRQSILCRLALISRVPCSTGRHSPYGEGCSHRDRTSRSQQPGQAI